MTLDSTSSTGATLRIAAELKNLAAIRDFVMRTTSALQASAKIVEDLALAADEAASSIMRHGYRLQPGEIEIEMKRDGEALVIYLRDQAPPFDPTRLPNPNITLPLEQRPVGGLGVYLIRQLVDTMHYRRTSQDQNELTLIKRAPPTSGGER